MSEIDSCPIELFQQLLAATQKAEQEPSSSSSGRIAWREVARLESLIAERPDISPAERLTAQRGFIAATRQAGDSTLARELSIVFHLEQSPHASERYALHLLGNNRLPGFPFAERLPVHRFDEYIIILADGCCLVASLDLSRQYGAEGIQWYAVGATYPQSSIAAWWSRRLVTPL